MYFACFFELLSLLWFYRLIFSGISGNFYARFFIFRIRKPETKGGGFEIGTNYQPATYGEKLLFDLRISAAFKGHDSLAKAIDLSLQDVALLEKGGIFERVAQFYQVDASCIQTVIKTALGHAQNGTLLYTIIGTDYSLNIHPMKFLGSVYWYINGVRPLLHPGVRNRLTPLGYAALVLRHRENHTFAEIAQIKGTTYSNVCAAYRYALRVARCLLFDRQNRPNQYLMYMYCVDEEQIETIVAMEKRLQVRR